MAKVKRAESVAAIERNVAILERIRELKAEHPFWGYRRVWACLRFADGLEVNKKRIFHLMQRNELLVKPDARLRAVRTPNRSKPRPERPNEWWGIDMTKVRVDGFGWVYIVVILDWFTKRVVGHYAGLQCASRHWLQALEGAIQSQFPGGVQEQRLSLMSDNGCQPTSISFIKACSTLGINQAFTSYNNPKGNADTERFFRTLKEELLWLRDWASPFELLNELDEWVTSYNTSYLHSALGYRSPAQFEAEYQNSQLTHILGP
jgi:putative transposase